MVSQEKIKKYVKKNIKYIVTCILFLLYIIISIILCKKDSFSNLPTIDVELPYLVEQYYLSNINSNNRDKYLMSNSESKSNSLKQFILSKII